MARRRGRDDVGAFVKQRAGTDSGVFAFEAAGLGWLREAHEEHQGVPIPWVHDFDRNHLTLDFVATTAPSPEAARVFGAQLARTHQSGAEMFGELPPRSDRSFIAELELPPGQWETFGSFYAQARVRPLADLALSRGAISSAQARDFAVLCDHLESEDPLLIGPPDPIARLHGDLWSGNVLWRQRDCVLIDASAHGGHRETDLAMLALFGLPYLDVVLEAYCDEWPLNDGFEARVELHQVYPLLVHAILFGGSYGASATRAARQAVARTRS
ncbi:MAG: fructosamine kinase family protein [Actinomycetota bacterium]|mgnify:FL=1|nr:fructosamine kinase [Micrococcales bacterium]MEC7104043.1 fructosamine kinase family protein [Actinomycetota bacterium]MEC7590224.1 fructosamine kinase family protein [Actinomycetota bacterium]MEC8647543.1 fructosamine kinase family protein [Actinomycetota bacterium]MEC9129556.1 fructosamine kinase family protein [Actinomycetota bacterium]